MPARACRGCLATDSRLYNIYKINLYEAFGDLVGSPIFESDDLPQHICSMCLVQLNKFVSFRDRCRLAQDLMEELKMQGIKLTTAFIQKIDRGKCNLLPNLKKVTPPSSDLIIHEHIPDTPPEEDPGLDHEVVEPLPLTDDTDQPAAPTDTTTGLTAQDPPIKTKRPTVKKAKPKNPPKLLPTYIFSSPEEIEKFKETYKVDVVFLTKEQQIEEVKEKILQSATRPGAGSYCSDCGKSCRGEEFLQKHIRECHDESPGTVQCDICRCRFTTKDMIKHVMFHKLKITCKECGFVSKSSCTSSTHAWMKHGLGPPKSLKCKYCDMVFESRIVMNTHITEAHSNKLLWCRCCAESFFSHGRINHMRRIHGDFLKSVHKCQKDCKRTFANKEALERHLSLTCEQFNCVMCGEHYETLLLLKEHVIQQHSRSKYIKLAQCSECDVKFFGTEPLVKHLEEMSCGKGFPCQVCGVSFPTKDAMEDHKAEFHLKLYRACEFCNKGFDSDNYRHHIQRVHNIKPPSRYIKGIHARSSQKVWSVSGGIIRGEAAAPPVPEPEEPPKKILMCDFCGRTFTKYQYLRIHTYQHTGERPFKCEVCQKGFIRASNLKTHMLLHTGEKPFMCQHCSKLFRTRGALSRHLLTHTGVRRHICHICKKSFATSNNIKFHIKAVHLNLPVRGPRKREFNAWIRKTEQNMNQGIDGMQQGDMGDDIQEQGFVNSDNTQGFIDCETSAAVAMISGSLEIPNKKPRLEDMNNAQDLMDASTKEFMDPNTQDYMDSEILRNFPSTARVKMVKKRGRPKQYVTDMDSSARTQDFMGTQEYMDNDAAQDDMVYDTLSRDITVTAVPRIIKTVNIRHRKKPVQVQERSMPSLNFDSDQVLMDTQITMGSPSIQNDVGNGEDYMDGSVNIQKQVYMDSGASTHSAKQKQFNKDSGASIHSVKQKQVYMDSGASTLSVSKQVYMDSGASTHSAKLKQVYMDSGANTDSQKQVYMDSGASTHSSEQKQVFIDSGASTHNVNSKQIILARQDLDGTKKYVIVGRPLRDHKNKPAPKINTRVIGWK